MNQQQRAEVELLASLFGYTPRKVEAFVNFYNDDYSTYGNEIYEDVRSRIAHWINFQRPSWFNKRLDPWLRLIRKRLSESDGSQPIISIDIGFSVPYVYTDADLVSDQRLRCVFVDKESSAAHFYNTISRKLGISRDGLDQVVVADIENTYDWLDVELAIRSVSSARNSAPRIIISASEVIEHLRTPSRFFACCAALEEIFQTKVDVFLTLPIGRQIPSHERAFDTTAAALRFVKKYMVVTSHSAIEPSEADGPVSPYLTACLCVIGRCKAHKNPRKKRG